MPPQAFFQKTAKNSALWMRCVFFKIGAFAYFWSNVSQTSSEYSKPFLVYGKNFFLIWAKNFRPFFFGKSPKKFIGLKDLKSVPM